MTPRVLETSSLQTFEKRFRSRLKIGLSLARVHRFVAELEPSHGDEVDPVATLGAAFRAFRDALRDQDLDGSLDAVERTWAQLEGCRRQVMTRDTAIQAYRVRWACENAPLRHQTIDGLAHYYRLLPFSTSSQSKYEYVLTRLLAGPIGPERQLAPTQELIDIVVALEASWGIETEAVEEGEVRTIILALKSFAYEATRRSDVAAFTASALLRRFGAFKFSIGDKLFDPRVSVAVVETNVAVLNVLNQLLTDAGSQPLTGTISVGQIRQRVRTHRASGSEAVTPAEPMPADSGPAPEEQKGDDGAGIPEQVRSDLHSGQIDVSGLAFRRRRKDGSSRQPSAPLASLLDNPPAAPPAEPAAHARTEEGAAEPPIVSRPELRTGEVDLSGLEFIKRHRQGKAGLAKDLDPDAKALEEARDSEIGDDAGDDEGPDEGATRSPVQATSSGVVEPPSDPEKEPAQDEQQPSLRAFDLGKLEENAATIEKYLAWPRSPEVWQLDLDHFLRPSASNIPNAEAATADKRRALELILSSDDLICERLTQDGAPPTEHRAKVKLVANAMLLLRTSLRRAADLAQGDPKELEPLLYVSDHLLWERLRLEASLKRNPRQRRAALLPRTNQIAEATLQRVRLVRRHRRILIRVVGLAAAVTALVGVSTIALPRTPVDAGVTLVRLDGLPSSQLFDEARAYRSTLFVTANRTWTLLGREERRSIVRGLATFAVDRGFNVVSVFGAKGEPLASFKDDEIILDGELKDADLVKR